ncbi:MAG: ribose 5-phosphate isomerase B [Clostridia bacterium]|nr:ribose 5-phosphate isomerase B [Clostridia bacterium]
MKISLACDHGGLQLKNHVAEFLKEHGYIVMDFGTFTKDRCDYPDFAKQAAQAVADGKCNKGIVICTTGIGVSIVANKVKGVRCALCINADMATRTRAHNDANMIAMGQIYVDNDTADEIVTAFLTTDFMGGRHQVRVDKIED